MARLGRRFAHLLDFHPLQSLRHNLDKHCRGPGLYLGGAPGEIRTPDLLVRSQTLYPAELRARNKKILAHSPDEKFKKTESLQGGAPFLLFVTFHLSGS